MKTDPGTEDLAGTVDRKLIVESLKQGATERGYRTRIALAELATFKCLADVLCSPNAGKSGKTTL